MLDNGIGFIKNSKALFDDFINNPNRTVNVCEKTSSALSYVESDIDQFPECKRLDVRIRKRHERLGAMELLTLVKGFRVCLKPVISVPFGSTEESLSGLLSLSGSKLK